MNPKLAGILPRLLAMPQLGYASPERWHVGCWTFSVPCLLPRFDRWRFAAVQSDLSHNSAVSLLDAGAAQVIDINYYPVKEAENSNMRHRPIGLGAPVAPATQPRRSLNPFPLSGGLVQVSRVWPTPSC